MATTTTKSNNEKTKTLLIVGGSIAGLAIITAFRKLDKTTEIVLVEPKEYVEFVWGTYRTPLDEKLAKKSICPLAPFCAAKNVQHVPSLVTQLDTKTATLEDGSTISFDAACIGVGASQYWSGLGRETNVASISDRLKQLKEEGNKLKTAKSILIVGGGLVGAELAGDVVEYCDSVTLVHSGDYLCPEMTQSAAQAVQCQLKKRGVRVVCGAKAVQNGNDDTTWELSTTGESLSAEQVVQTIGMKPRNTFLDDQHLDDKGWIVTNEHFCVKNTDNLFALGDCNTHAPNSANSILNDGTVVAHNVHQVLMNNQDSSKFKTAVPSNGVFICTTGPSSGVAQLPFTWTRFFLPWLKNWTMLYFSFKHEFGLKGVE